MTPTPKPQTLDEFKNSILENSYMLTPSGSLPETWDELNEVILLVIDKVSAAVFEATKIGDDLPEGYARQKAFYERWKGSSDE